MPAWERHKYSSIGRGDRTAQSARYYQKYRQRMRANSVANYAIKTGKIERSEVCENCTRKCKTLAHHEDYAKPLDIIWLCQDCHNTRHGKFRRIK